MKRKPLVFYIFVWRAGGFLMFTYIIPTTSEGTDTLI